MTADIDIERQRALNRLKAACAATRDPEVAAAYYDFAMADAKAIMASTRSAPRRRKWWRRAS